MIPDSIANFYMANQEILWLTTLALDLAFVVLLFRLFGKAGLMVAISTAIILANLQGPKLTVIFGMETSLGVIFYSSIFFATDVLSENYGRKAANKAVWMGFTVSVDVELCADVPAERPPCLGGVFATDPWRFRDDRRFRAQRRVRFFVCLPRQSTLRRLGLPPDQTVDR